MGHSGTGFFAAHPDRYNLIFAPHLKLIRRWLHKGTKVLQGAGHPYSDSKVSVWDTHPMCYQVSSCITENARDCGETLKMQ